MYSVHPPGLLYILPIDMSNRIDVKPPGLSYILTIDMSDRLDVQYPGLFFSSIFLSKIYNQNRAVFFNKDIPTRIEAQPLGVHILMMMMMIFSGLA